MTSMNLTSEQTNELLYVGFNQDFGCFACGTDNGFRIYNVDPFRETFRRVFSIGGIGIVEMLFRCNLLALVGGGKNPRYPPNKVMIWDDHQNRCIGELSFRSEVKSVKMRRDRIAVVLLEKIYVYRFSDLKLLDQLSTSPNILGLIALSPDSSNTVLAFPAIHHGHVQVELYDHSRSVIIPAHETQLSQIALSMDGTRLASASEKGTLIRIFDSLTGDLMQELRRGMDRALIYSLCFNMTNTLIACSSDKGTVHIFSLVPDANRQGQADSSSEGKHEGTAADESNTYNNTKSGLAFMRGLIPNLVPRYFGSEWSFAQVRGLEGGRCICGFDSNNADNIITISANGQVMSSSFKEPGECRRLTSQELLLAERQNLDNDDSNTGDNAGEGDK